MHRKPNLQRTLLSFFGLLVGGGVIVSAIVVSLTLPFLDSPGLALLMLAGVVGAIFTVEWAVGSWLLRRRLAEPVDELIEDVKRIAAGDHRHRVRELPWSEFEAIRQSTNTMADRLVEGRAALAENVASLDRTNRKLVAARDQVLQSARLAAVGTLAAGIAHEIGNPLGAVLGYIDVALRRTRAAGGETEILESARSEVERIDHIIRSLLDYARPDSEAGEEAVDASAVLMRVRDFLERQGKLEGIRTRFQLPDGVRAAVVLQPRALEQVFVNLILNARDAVADVADPEIRVTVSVESGEADRLPPRRDQDPPEINYMHRRRVSRDAQPGGAAPLFTAATTVTLRVADNGPGIPPEIRARIFDPFFTTKDPGSGTGLGLAICARLVEGMGGRIAVEEGREGGAALVVRLPGAPDLEPDPPPAAPGGDTTGARPKEGGRR
jgi:hypothetical protein